MANKNFVTLKTNIGQEVQDTSSAFSTILGRFINRRYFQILRAINWQNLRTDYSITTTSGTKDYVLPDDFDKEISVEDGVNDILLTRLELQDISRNYPGATADAGTVYRYSILEDTVQKQPTSASTLSIVSSSASDNTQTILIRGIVSGYETSETVLLTGITPAVTTNTYSRVKGISKSSNTVGKVTVTSNTGAVTQSVLPPKILESRYKLIRLHYVPTTTLVLSVVYIIKPLPLTEDYDYPVLDIADLLEIGVLADAWRYKRQFAKAQTMEILFNQELSNYIWSKENSPNMIFQFCPTTYNNDDLY